ncbi:MAG: hypothetical protein V5A52_01960 [Halovenus sp.]|uniref:hypothetical protein n=1 Tax=Halovenus amylolytica TaxID=2500550 RepID=UPI000FE440BB
MTPCRRCGAPAADSRCERCHGVRRLVPDGGEREADRWNPALNEEWDSQARAAYLERQARSNDQSPSSESANSSSKSTANSPTGAPDGESQADSDELPKDERQSDGSGVTDRLTRRRLLLGGAGLAVVATGGRQLLSGGLDGAKGVAESYIEAVAANDWEAAGQLYHEKSRIRQDIDDRGSVESYEDVIDERGDHQFLSDIEPEIEGIHEWRDVPDPNAERPDARFVPSGASELDGYKQIIAIVSLDAVTLYRARGMDDMLEQLEGERTNEVFQIGTVKDLTEWSLWSVSYPV